MLMSDLTSLVPPQFSHRLQVRKAGTLNVVFVVVVVVVVTIKNKSTGLYKSVQFVLLNY